MRACPAIPMDYYFNYNLFNLALHKILSLMINPKPPPLKGNFVSFSLTHAPGAANPSLVFPVLRFLPVAFR